MSPIKISVVPGSAQEARSSLAQQLEQQAEEIGRREKAPPQRRTVRVPLGAVLRCALLPVVALPPIALRALHVAGIVAVLVAEQVEDTAADVRAVGEMAVALVVWMRGEPRGRKGQQRRRWPMRPPGHARARKGRRRR